MDQEPKKSKVNEDVEKNKGMAALAYFIFFLPLLTEAKDSPFVKFHVKQTIVLIVAAVAIAVVGVIPFIGWLIAAIAPVALLVLWVIGLLNAINGKEEYVPWIGKYADQFLKF